MLSSRWFLEFTTDEEASLHSLKETLHSSQSHYQRIEILRLGSYGKCLVLDGKLQSTELDEFIYHETLVHPALLTQDEPEKILIAGGGEGATIREVLRYPTVESVYMIDLDEEVVQACKLHLKEWHQGCYDDPRVKVIFEDARRFIVESDEMFDAVILDLPEPMDGGPAIKLYTREFYRHVSERLKPGGVMVTQATTISVNNFNAFNIIHNTLKNVFSTVRGYWTSVPSFYVPWGFIFASNTKDPLKLSREKLESRLKSLGGSLRFYNPEIHFGMFALPQYLKDGIDGEKRVNTDDNPLSFY
jgi:spermidine synthase